VAFRIWPHKKITPLAPGSSGSPGLPASLSKKPETGLAYASLSNEGLLRLINQDSSGIFPEEATRTDDLKGRLFIVADGMGGLIEGKVASEMAVQIISQAYFAAGSSDASQSLLQAFENANREIFLRAQAMDPLQKMGTTCSTLVLIRDRGIIAHVGDSRIYRIRWHVIEQLTQDHTEEGEVAQDGPFAMAEGESRSRHKLLSRALGIEPNVIVDLVKDIFAQSGDVFVLCTDGLSGVGHEEIKEIVVSYRPQEACRMLIQRANQKGGEDNITVQVIQIL
jgi:serine/threonine protein phosphatase PrpC